MIDRQRIDALSPKELQLLATNLRTARQPSRPAVAGEPRSAATLAEAVSGAIPLTPSQKSYFDFAPREPNYFVVTALQDCPGRLSATLIGSAIRHLLAHHDALRLRFQRGERGWYQRYADPDEEQSSFESVDLTGLEPAEHESCIARTARTLSRSLDLTQGPLLRVVLFELGSHRPQRLLLVVHHLLVDLLSLRILLDDLRSAHEQLELGSPVRLPANTAPFGVYAEKLQAYSRSAAARGEVAYWRSLPWAAVEHLPVDHPGGVNAIESIRTVAVSLNVEDTRSLTEEVPLVYGARVNKVLLAALLESLTRWSGRRSFAIDVLEHGRNGSFLGLDLSRTLGWFSSEYPLVLASRAGVRDADVLQLIGKRMRTVPNDGATYGVLRYLSEADPLATIPLPEIRFNYQGRIDHHLVSDEALDSPNSTGEDVAAHYGQAMRRHLLNVAGLVIGNRLRMNFEYSPALHKRQTIETLAAGFVECLREFIASSRGRSR